jgi:hypothetical protein
MRHCTLQFSSIFPPLPLTLQISLFSLSFFSIQSLTSSLPLGKGTPSSSHPSTALLRACKHRPCGLPPFTLPTPTGTRYAPFLFTPMLLTSKQDIKASLGHSCPYHFAHPHAHSQSIPRDMNGGCAEKCTYFAQLKPHA